VPKKGRKLTKYHEESKFKSKKTVSPEMLAVKNNDLAVEKQTECRTQKRTKRDKTVGGTTSSAKNIRRSKRSNSGKKDLLR